MHGIVTNWHICLIQRAEVLKMRGNQGRSLATLAICGGIGGVIGASCMTVVRIVAQRAGHIDKQVPQAAEEWLLDRVGGNPPGGHAGHHALDQLLHLGYGAAWGVL
jgi:hypothetical protein